MRLLLLFILTISLSTFTYSQSNLNIVETLERPVDTIDTESGKIIIYSDRTWEYLYEINLDASLNSHLNSLIATDSNYLYKSYWRNNVTITYNENPVDKMKDTIWMCVIDSLHHNYSLPVKNVNVTSKYGIRHGRNHNGTDLDLETGDTVYAVFDGKIRYSQYHSGGFGNLVIMRHYNGLETYYGHLSKLLVDPNAIVKAGDPIGLGGNTGRSTGSHLHFEVRFYDQPINPESIFDFKKEVINDPNLFVHKGVFEHSHSSSSSTSSKTGSSSKKYYKIRSGDTLSGIAKRNRTSVSALCRLNKMRVTDTLRIGKTIRVK